MVISVLVTIDERPEASMTNREVAQELNRLYSLYTMAVRDTVNVNEQALKAITSRLDHLKVREPFCYE